MSNQQMWSMVVGFILPLAIAFILQEHWPEAFQAAVAFVVCVVVAVGTVLVSDPGWSWHDWIKDGLLILVTAIATYKGIWKPTTVATSLRKATTLPQRRTA